MNVSIVIPAHNEEESIAATLRNVLESVTVPYELIVVADHCHDQTEKIVQDFMKKYPQIRMVKNTERRGSFSNSVICGLKSASMDTVVPIMADRCDDPMTINRMLLKIEEGFDVVCASRYMHGGKKSGGPILQNILSRIVCFSLRILTGIPTWDAANSFKMYRRSFLETLVYDIPNAGTEYSMALLFRAYAKQARITEIPTKWEGQSIPMNDEWKILKRIPGYSYWYGKAVHRRMKPLK